MYLLVICISLSCISNEHAKSVFKVKEYPNGLELTENETPVFFYQKTKKEGDYPEFARNNYIHPLYSISGDTLTEDFPEDHPYHHGLYWSWHQILAGDSLIGDYWVMKDFVSTITDSKIEIKNGTAQLSAYVNWSSTVYNQGKPFLSERSTYSVYPLKNGVRVLDIETQLIALVDSISIGGANNQKGYGGLCIRLKLPEDLTFTASSGAIVPDTYQIRAGGWMDFSATFSGEHRSGVTLMCHSSTIGYPQKWILRQKTSMQNIVYPGELPVDIPMSQPLTLRYRLLIHDGLSIDELKKHEEWYNRSSF